MIWTFLILLPCLVQVALAAPSGGCPAMVQCELPVRAESFFADTRSIIFKLKDSAQLDRVCGKVATLKACINTHAPSCDDAHGVKFSIFFKDTMDYICTPAGRTVALTAKQTSCKMEPQLDAWFLNMKRTCRIDFFYAAFAAEDKKGGPLTSAEVCPLKSIQDQCVKSAMDKKCGPEMAALIEKMWALWINQDFEGYGC